MGGRVCTAGSFAFVLVAYKSPEVLNINLQDRSNENGRENKTCTTYQAVVQQPVWTALRPAKIEDCQAFVMAFVL